MKNNVTILIVDDDSDIRYILSKTLKKEGYKVIEAADGFEGIESVQEQKPDLVILDIMMPRMSGWEACDKIKEIDPYLPIAILTVKGAETDEVKSFVSGANRHLTKPMKKEEVLEVVAELLEISKHLN